MSPAEALFSTTMVLALLCYGALVLASEMLGSRIERAVSGVPISEWLVRRLGGPLLRALEMVVFIILAYPDLFALEAAPALYEILPAGSGRVTALVNVMFVLTLLLPLVPGIGSVPALVLPLQGVAAAALVFHWLSADTGVVAASYWPGLPLALAVVALAIVSHEVGARAARALGRQLDRSTNRTGFQRLAYRVLLLYFQVPVILLYTMTLGRQLAV